MRKQLETTNKHIANQGSLESSHQALEVEDGKVPGFFC